MNTTYNRKKVLFLITKSNWGEKWAGTHFARLIEIFLSRREKDPMSGQRQFVEKWEGVKNDKYHSLRGCQLFLKKIATTCTGPVRTHFARPCQRLCEYLKQSSDQVYSVCKTALSRPIILTIYYA